MDDKSSIIDKKKPGLVFFLTGFVFSGFGLYHADKLKWYCDEAFIILRYVQNWIEGKGLVFNAGEYVDGYSSFFWVLILKFRQFFNISEIDWMLNAGLICFIGLLVLYLYNSYRLRSSLPLTVIALALHYDFKVWVTGGLETMLYTLLISLVFTVFIILNKFSFGKRLAVSSLILTLLMLTRPDGFLFYMCANIFLVGYIINSKPDSKTILKYFAMLNLFVAAIGIPFIIWKWNLYGDQLQNIFYLKTGSDSYISDGFYYLYSYFANYPSSLICMMGTPVVMIIYRHGKTRTKRLLYYVVNDKESVLLLSIMVMTFVYIFGFILKMGGDLMFAKYMVPIIPLFYFSVELVLVILIRSFKSFEKKRGFIFSMAAISLMLLSPIEKELRTHMFIDNSEPSVKVKEWHGISDQRLLDSKVKDLTKAKEMGEELRPYIAGMDMRVLSLRDACFSHYANFSYVLNNFGVMDKNIAGHVQYKTSLVARQNDSASYEYIMNKNINFCFNNKMFIDKEYRKVQMETGNYIQNAEMFYYNKGLIKELKKRFNDKFKYVDLENYFNEFISESMNTMDKEQVHNLYMKYKEYYFDPNFDRVTNNQSEQILGYINEK